MVDHRGQGFSPRLLPDPDKAHVGSFSDYVSEYDLERVACLGCCALAPVVTVDNKTYAQMSVLKLQRLLDECQDD